MSRDFNFLVLAARSKVVCFKKPHPYVLSLKIHYLVYSDWVLQSQILRLFEPIVSYFSHGIVPKSTAEAHLPRFTTISGVGIASIRFIGPLSSLPIDLFKIGRVLDNFR